MFRRLRVPRTLVMSNLAPLGMTGALHMVATLSIMLWAITGGIPLTLSPPMFLMAMKLVVWPLPQQMQLTLTRLTLPSRALMLA